MNILITAFDAFNNQDINPTQLIIDHLPDKIQHHVIDKLLLETVRYKSIHTLIHQLKSKQYDAIVMLGYAQNSDGFHVERVAINVDDFRIVDNEQNQPIDEKIHEDGANAYFSTLPIKAIVTSLLEHGFKASISNSAGTFVCNHLFYGCAYHLQKTNKRIPFGFVHVPNLSTQKNSTFSYSLSDMLKAVVVIIETITLYQKDIKISGGKEY
mgnify:FL=1